MAECRTIEWWGGYQKQILWVRLVSDSKIEEKGTVLERQFSHFL
jgi:hypothetical protein